jgi:UDP-N-acetyl-D-glucosamine 2-epimerase, UDP-hydrolysing
MYKIAIVTTTRAEYGLLYPLIRGMVEDDELELKLIVSGTHLSKKHGYTIGEIIKDGFSIAHIIPIMEDGNLPYDISIIMANAIRKFAECFREDRPDMLVISGDRTEMMAIACAAMNERIPMAHYSGGEVTEGAIDDCIRHSLTKMSYLHFTSTEIYRRRVIRLGEDPKRVFNVGALGMENIMKAPLLDEREIRQEEQIPLNMKYIVVTFHPVTLETSSAGTEAEEICKVMDKKKDYFYLITKANADAEGDEINHIFEVYAMKHNNAKLVDSLGMLRYLSAIKYAALVLGNSSSGMVEAAILGTPTVNIGDRQKGRISTETVVNCRPEEEQIIEAIQRAENIPHRGTNIYGMGDASRQILMIIKETLRQGKINLKKGFYEG